MGKGKSLWERRVGEILATRRWTGAGRVAKMKGDGRS
jgi:hypothetical protein